MTAKIDPATIAETLRLFVELGDPSLNRPKVPFSEEERCYEEVLALADRLDIRGEPRVGDLVRVQDDDEYKTIYGGIVVQLHRHGDDPVCCLEVLRLGWDKYIPGCEHVTTAMLTIIARAAYEVEDGK